MIFLIQYKRSAGETVKMKEFDDSERSEAEDARLALDLELIGKKDPDEVCLLEARSKEALRQTHRRYFESLRMLIASGRSTVASLDKP